MSSQEKIVLLEDLFEMKEGSLQAEAELTKIENWDSMTKLSLIVFMDEECSKILKTDDIKGFKTIQDIMDFMG